MLRVVGSPDRLLVVGQAPAKGAEGAPAFSGKSGAKLANLLGFDSVAGMLAMVDTVNVLDRWPGRAPSGRGDAFPLREARQAAAGMVVLARTCLLVGGASTAFGFSLPLFTEGALLGRSGTRYFAVPHTSGVNRWWNKQQNRDEAASFFAMVRAWL